MQSKRRLNDALKIFYPTRVLRIRNVTIKIKCGINRKNVPLFHLDEHSNYYFPRFARKIKYISEIKLHFIPA